MSGPRILIVEDDAILAAHLVETLSQLGYQVAGLAATGREAVKMALSQQLDAILMDIRLRGEMTGIQAAEEIHKQTDIPVVYLTAYTDEALLQQAKATDAYAYQAKPVRDRELRASLEMVLYKNASERKVAHLNQVLRAVRNVNQLITRERDPSKLLETACQILVQTRGFSLVWIGKTEAGEKLVHPVARAGKHSDYLDEVRITWDRRETGKGPTGRAVRTRKPVVFHDLATHPDYKPWREAALKRGFVSSAAIPMLYHQKLYGVLSVYADGPNVFDDEEMDLLKELAGDLAFGLSTLEEEAAHLRAEETLKRSEVFLDSIIEHSPHAMWVSDDKGTLIRLNQACRDLLHINDEEVVGKYNVLKDNIVEEQGLMPHVKRVFATGKTVKFTIRYDSSQLKHLEMAQTVFVILDTTISPVLDANGKVTNAIIQHVDITARLRAEEALCKAEEKYRTLVEQIPIVIYEAEPGCHTLYISPQIKQFTGFSQAKWMADPDLWIGRLHPQDKQRVLDENARVLPTPENYTSEYRIIGKDGRIVWIHDEGQLVMGAPGAPPIFRGIWQDVTARKRAEEAQQQSELLLRALFELSPDAVVLIDPHDPNVSWPIIDCNAAACLMNGYRRDELIGHSIDVVNLTSGTQDERSAYMKQLREAGNLKLETTHRHKNGTVFPIEVSTTLIKVGERELVIGIDRDITERKRAENALCESEAQLSNAMDIARLGYWEYDVASDQFTFNDHFYSVFRTTAEREGGYKMSSARYAERFVHPDEISIVGTEIQKALETPDPHYSSQLEHRIIYADGETGYIAVRFFVVKDDQGCTVKTFGANQDITERKRAEEALRESRLLFSSLIESLPQNIYAKDINGRFIFANQRYCATQGKQLEDIIGETDTDLHPPELAKKYQADDRRVLETGQTIELEEDHQPISGKKFTVQVIKAPLFGAKGQITGTLGIFWEITERKQAEEALRESEEHYRGLVELSPETIFIEKDDGTIAFINQAGLKLFGAASSEQILGRHVMDLIHPDCRGIVSDRFRAVRDEGKVVPRIEEKFLRLDGSSVDVDVAATPFVYNGKLGAQVIARDITERKRAEELLAQQAEELSRRNEMLTRLYRASGSLMLVTALSLQELAQVIVGVVQKEFGKANCSVFLIQEGSKGIERVAVAGPYAEEVSRKALTLDGPGLVPQAIVANRVLNTPDVRVVPYYVPSWEAARSEMTIPLEIGDRVIGAIDIQSEELNAFSVDDEQIMTVFAERAAMALENARLYQAAQKELAERGRVEEMLREHVKRLRSLNEIDRAILVSRSLDEIAKIVLGEVRLLIPCTQVSIVLYGEQTGEEHSFLMKADGNITDHSGQRPPLDPAWSARLKTGTEIIVDDLQEQPLEPPLPLIQTLIQGGIRSFLSMPLLVQDDLIGIINLDSFQPRFFGAAHAEIARDIAVQVALAIRQAQLYEQVRRHSAELEQRVTERTEELHRANAALTRASRLKDEFLASMSHELRTPLTGVLNLSEALQEQVYGPLNEKQLKSLSTIEESGRHLLGLINDILDLSKIEAGQLDLQIESCLIGDVCQSSLQMIKGLAQKKHQSISYSIDPASIQLHADPRRLKQMLVNLLSNAVKFTPEESSIGLQVEGDAEAQAVRFTVWDTGIGIAPEDLPKLFHPFTQLDSSLSRQQSGTGLGLTLVQRMADLHGGGVSVESTPGQGSRFTITLPWTLAGTVSAPSTERKGLAPLRKVLTVEDVGLDAAHLTRLLSELDIFNIVHAHAEGVVELAAETLPDVILLDINLPDRSGWEVLADLKADRRTRDIPVLIASVEEERGHATASGAVGYLVKPFSSASLRAELERVISQASAPDRSVPAEGMISGPLVLLADDNEANIGVFSDYLQAKGYRVAVARHGGEAVALAQGLKPDLLLMDIQMPGMDGLEAIRRIRASLDQQVAATLIIALTALAMPGDRERCLAAGANEYLSKPVRLQELMRAILAQLADQEKS